MPLQITITDAGRAEIINAENTGTEKVTITAVAFGTGQYTPSKAQTALKAEVKRVGSIAGQAVAADTIHVMAKDESSDAYNVGEFGLISNKGTLIAVYSQLPAAGWIIQKAAPSTLLLATDIILESLDTSVIEFGDITFTNPPATASVAGVTKLVNTLTSTDTTSALTAAMGKKLQDEKQANIAAGSTAQYWRGDKNWRDFATDVRAAVLTGLSTASAAAVSASDSVLSALGKLQAQITGLATSKLDATANAVSATKLETARTIGGVAFDGTANINLPGVNVAGNQNTTGNAATATKLETARTIGGVAFDGTANINLPGVNVAGNQNTTGNAATASKLKTARTITLSGDVTGSASFDGSANVTITATVGDDSHNHIISNVDGLQAALDSKAASSHTHSISQVTGLQAALDAKAPLASPALTGTPTAPTAAVGTNTTQLATTAFVNAEIANDTYLKAQFADRVTSKGANANGSYRVWASGRKDIILGAVVLTAPSLTLTLPIALSSTIGANARATILGGAGFTSTLSIEVLSTTQIRVYCAQNCNVMIELNGDIA